MEVIDKPEITMLAKGYLIKTFQVKGHTRTIMPSHYCTTKAFLVVEEGRALMHILESEPILKTGFVFVILAGKEHILSIQENFKGVPTKDIDSKINFT